MTSVLTGDIINSAQYKDSAIWQNPLKTFLSRKGDTPRDWEIFQGDSFQLQIPPPEALRTAFQAKAVIRQIKDLDIRIAIGLGTVHSDPGTISEKTGVAFSRSGRLLDKIKKEKVHMAVGSMDPEFDAEMNMMLKLALLTINNWTQNSAEIAELLLENPDLKQTDIGRKLGITQSSVSERIQRGAVREILELEQYYCKRIKRIGKTT